MYKYTYLEIIFSPLCNVSSMQSKDDNLQKWSVRKKQDMPWKTGHMQMAIPVGNTIVTKWKADFWKAQEDKLGMAHLQC